ncbi:MAG TPA: SDR family NAD(P)-dependent oxidoreductase [Gemmataceae bacterium]|nr:SDR family NAD(P)-dependent oxidoreductase [Gemmataceae bacterium]
MAQLSGKTALVTGGSTGIGLAIARSLLEQGARVAISARDEGKLRKTAESLDAGERLSIHPADVAEPDQVARMVRTATERLGQIDILISNAGLNIKERSVRELTPERWQRLVRANLDGAFYCTHAVLPDMLRRRDGYIIYISSIAGKRAYPFSGAGYAAAKFGMSALGQCLAAEETESGIRVSVIYPGEVDTPILEARPQPLTPEHRQRILQPEDVAAAVLFVLSLPPRASVPELVIKPTSQVYL